MVQDDLVARVCDWLLMTYDISLPFKSEVFPVVLFRFSGEILGGLIQKFSEEEVRDI